MASADMNISPTAGMEGEGTMSAGEFVLKKLFAEFVVLSERKLQVIATQPPVSVLRRFPFGNNGLGVFWLTESLIGLQLS